jgi:hypothetical protein
MYVMYLSDIEFPSEPDHEHLRGHGNSEQNQNKIADRAHFNLVTGTIVYCLPELIYPLSWLEQVWVRVRVSGIAEDLQLKERERGNYLLYLNVPVKLRWRRQLVHFWKTASEFQHHKVMILDFRGRQSRDEYRNQVEVLVLV